LTISSNVARGTAATDLTDDQFRAMKSPIEKAVPGAWLSGLSALALETPL
jgi:hypothetical protein